jgi:hypothetical protein
MRPFNVAAVALAAALAIPTAALADRAPAPPASQSPASPPLASPPSSQPSARLAPLEQSAIPEPCRPLAKQAQAPSLAAALSARISLASCMAERAVAPLALCDCGASILAVDTAVAPALAVLDGVIEAGDPAIQVLAEHTRGQLLAGFAARLLATLPTPGPGADNAEITLRDMRKQTLEAQLAPWRDAARAAFQRVVELAGAHPELASNPAVMTAVRDSRQRLAAEVAAR